MSFTEEQLKEMAIQLSCPRGDNGIGVADMMHDTNFGMTKSTIDALKITDHDSVLELGHGNGKHISTIIQAATAVSYYGLEISELMKQEAAALHIANSSFYSYDGENIPFEDGKFNKAMTVNTIYFWKNPVQLLNEVYRVLKTDGLFCVTFAQKDFMEMLPFTQHGFNLYDNEKLEDLVKQSSFKLVSFTAHTEQVKSKADEMVERAYTVATLQK
jgi:ubiquinone/menaquinone biosynthesis C-methylase UbiE